LLRSTGRLLYLTGLLRLNTRLPVQPPVLVEALATHVDVAADSIATSQQAWMALAQMLNTAAKLVTDLEVKHLSLVNAIMLLVFSPWLSETSRCSTDVFLLCTAHRDWSYNTLQTWSS